MWRYAVAWIPMVLIAIGNGAARQLWYGDWMSELHAHQISTIGGVVLLGAYMWFVVRLWPPGSAGQAIGVGLLWLVLTLAFEFLFGRYVAGHSWERLFHDYDLLAGRIWILVLVWVAVAPYVFLRLRR